MDDRFCQCRIDLHKITVSEVKKKILLEHACNELPNESCAMLFGRINGKNAIVEDVFLTENADQSPVRFTIPNEQLIKGYKIAERKNMGVVGIFHSHPSSGAYPSDIDKEFMQSNPVVWVIYSGSSEEFRSYIMEKEVIEVLTEFL